jgi:hypothetical protein
MGNKDTSDSRTFLPAQACAWKGKGLLVVE